MAQKVVLCTLLVCTWIATHGQSAPPFEVVDSDGLAHDLYADYLDQGRVVMVHLFYSSCPPCQTIAGQLEELYQEWGAGEHDVQFLGLSNQEWETDATVNTFKSTLGVTIPSVSAEGGSIPAVDALVNGGFGDYFGAPLYLVIAADGSVAWDIYGFGDEATIDSIDAALKRTGASKPTSHVGRPPSHTVHIFPNPATSYIQINGFESPNYPVSYLLSSASGVTMTAGDLLGGRIDLTQSGLTDGTYLLAINATHLPPLTHRVIVLSNP